MDLQRRFKVLKKIICLGIFFLLSQNQSSGQTYFHTPDSNATWYSDYQRCCPEWHTYNLIHIAGDSIMNGHVYHVLKSPGSNYKIAAYREDSTKKVYIVDFSSPNKEYLLYDFSLGVGDSVHTYQLFHQARISTIIKSIDSILIKGVYRKQWNLNTEGYIYDNVYKTYLGITSWIEGIGSDAGFTEGSYIFFEENFDLLCFQQNSQLIYTANSNCEDILGVSLKNKVDPPFHIYPSVTQDEINVSYKSAGLENIEVSIYNSLGQKVYCKKTDHSEFHISVSNFNQGIYFLSIVDQNGKVNFNKFIKE